MHIFAAIAAAFLVTAGSSVNAAELKCLFPLALKSALGELIPQFEKLSGDKVVVEYGLIGAMAKRLQENEAADVAILADGQIAELQVQGRIVDGSRTGVTRLGFGAFTALGVAKPDISSVEAFRKTLQAARSAAYVDPATGAPSGIYMAKLIGQLGMSEEMKPKTRLTQPLGPLFDAVINGDAEIGFTLISEILAEPRVVLVGPFPTGIQNHILYTAGLVAKSAQQRAGRDLLTFLTSAPVQATMKAKGFERF